MSDDIDAAVEQLRIAIGVALVQAGQDDGDLIEAHPCPGCPGQCACSGVPYVREGGSP